MNSFSYPSMSCILEMSQHAWVWPNPCVASLIRGKQDIPTQGFFSVDDCPSPRGGDISDLPLSQDAILTTRMVDPQSKPAQLS